jgi:hypothetical protein
MLGGRGFKVEKKREREMRDTRAGCDTQISSPPHSGLVMCAPISSRPAWSHRLRSTWCDGQLQRRASDIARICTTSQDRAPLVRPVVFTGERSQSVPWGYAPEDNKMILSYHTIFGPHVLHKLYCGLPKHARPHTQHGHAQGDTQCTSRLETGQLKHTTV